MPSDDEARRLLHLAGDTVEVAPAGPVAAPPRRPWWPIIAAAATVALVAAVLALALPGGDREPAPAPLTPDDGRFRLGPDQVPSVFGLTAQEAVHLLEDRGLRVRVETRATCREVPGRALWTRPDTGTLVAPGDEVVVTTPDPATRCVAGLAGVAGSADDRADAWQLLDFADGRGTAPGLAAEVTVYDGDDRTTLSREEAADPASWPGFGAVRQALTEVQRLRIEHEARVRFRTPTLSVRHSSESTCGSRPDGLVDRTGLALSVGIPTDGPIGRCLEVTVFRNAGGLVDTVLIAGRPETTDLPGPPDVVGDSAVYARDRLESAGYAVEEVARRDCGQVGTVAAQDPSWGDDVAPGTTVVLGVVEERASCNTSELTAPTPLTRAADALIAFARDDGPAPEVADAVEVYIGDELHATISASQAQDADAWAPVLEVLRGPVATSEGSGTGDDHCLLRGRLPDGLDDEDAIRLSQPEPAGCADDWSVLAWVDDSGAVRAVDLLRGARADS